jgi:DNA-directed RNA polymerase III subunit RPC8
VFLDFKQRNGSSEKQLFCLLQVLSEEIDKKYANQVIPDVGLVICVNDFTTVEDAIIYSGDGGAHHRVAFRLLVFRPFVGEICVGTIVSSDHNGLRLSLDFFEDIRVPHFLLPFPSEYDSRQKLWAWRYEGAGDGEMGVFHVDEQIRFRVEGVTYTKFETTESGVRRTTTNSTESSGSAGLPPPPPGIGEGNGVRQRSLSITEDLAPEAPIPPCMSITASVKDPGLGLVAWSFE